MNILKKIINFIFLISFYIVVLNSSNSILLAIDNDVFLSKKENKQYQLIVIDNQSGKSEIQKIIFDNFLYFYNINAIIFKKESYQTHAWHSLIKPEWLDGGVAWVLLVKGGGSLGGGPGKPSVKSLQDLFDQKIGSNWVMELEHFLEAHPDNVEARLEVLRGYIHRAIALTRRLKANGTVAIQDEDEFIWSPIVRHSRHLLSVQAHPGRIAELFWGLPEEEIEINSLLMCNLYRKIKPVLVSYLNQIYTDAEVFYFLIRIDRVLDSHGVQEALENTSVIQTPLHFLFFAPNISSHILRSAEITGNYDKSLPILTLLWSHRKSRLIGGIPQADSIGFNKLQNRQLIKTQAREVEQLYTAWNDTLKPLLIALVKNNENETKVLSLLSNLDERWRVAPISLWLQALAVDLDRRDLIKSWLACTETLGTAPLVRLGLAPTYELFVMGEQSKKAAELCAWLRARGYRISVHDDLEQWHIKQLEWMDHLDHWALVAPAGEIMAKGARVPGLENGLEVMRSAGLKTPMELLEEFLEEHPEQIFPKFLLAMEWVQYLGFVQTLSGSPLVDGLESYIARGEMNYLDLLEALLVDPKGIYLAAKTLPAWPVLSSDRNPMAKNLRRIALDRIPEVERLIRNDPGNESLGMLWCGLGSLVGRSWRSFQSSIEISPSHPHGWASHGRLQMYFVRLLEQHQRWAEIPAELVPAWTDFLASPRPLLPEDQPNPQVEFANWLVTSLVRAYLSIGEVDKAERVILDWALLAPDAKSRANLIGLTESLGHSEEAKKWTKIWKEVALTP